MSIIPIIPYLSFEETMEIVTERQKELRRKGSDTTYEYELDEIYYPAHQLYNSLIEDAFEKAIAEVEVMDIKPRYVDKKLTPMYFKLILLLREFHHNCMAAYFNSQNKEFRERDRREAQRLREFPPLKSIT